MLKAVAPSAAGAAPIDPALIGPVPQWVKVGNALAHTSFQAAAVSKTNTLFSLLAGGIVHAVKIKHSTAFGGGGIATYTIQVGIASAHAKYASAFDVFQAVAATTFQLSLSSGTESHGAAVDITVTGTADINTSNSTSGVVDIWALLSTAT